MLIKTVPVDTFGAELRVQAQEVEEATNKALVDLVASGCAIVSVNVVHHYGSGHMAVIGYLEARSPKDAGSVETF